MNLCETTRRVKYANTLEIWESYLIIFNIQRNEYFAFTNTRKTSIAIRNYLLVDRR